MNPNQKRLMPHHELLGIAIRLALHPNEPGRIRAYVDLADCLVEDNPNAWALLEKTLLTLINSANDVQLPFAWRVSCLDFAYRPYRSLYRLPSDQKRLDRMRVLGYRLAAANIFDPPPSQPQASEGSPYV